MGYAAILWVTCAVAAVSLSALSHGDENEGHKIKSLSINEDLSSRHEARRLSNVTETPTLFLAVVNSIRKISIFLAREADSGNDDLFFTLRVAQGQLWQLRQKSSALYTGEVAALLAAAEEDLSVAAHILERNLKVDSYLSDDFDFIMDPALGRRLKRIDPTPAIANFRDIWLLASILHDNVADHGVPFQEDESDQCLGQLNPQNLSLVTSMLTGRNSYCSVDYPCWLMMVKPGAAGYYITHQAMYFILGEMMGCTPDFDALAHRYFGSLLPARACAVGTEILRQQCQDVLAEAYLYASQNFPINRRDLFLEQGFLCGGAVNMPQFFDPSWIVSVISWQKPSGCYGFHDEPIMGRSVNSQPEREGTWTESSGEVSPRKEISSPGENAAPVEGDGHPAPTSRREKPMSGSCFSHNTGLALTYLSVALKYLAD